MIDVAEHLKKIFNSRQYARSISVLCDGISRSKINFEFIAFRGYSGSMIAPAVAHKLNKQMCLIRKGSEKRHSARLIEGFVGGRYIIVDDLISTGNTIRQIIKSLNSRSGKEWNCSESTCVGVFLYDTDYYKSEGFLYKDKSIPVYTLGDQI